MVIVPWLLILPPPASTTASVPFCSTCGSEDCTTFASTSVSITNGELEAFATGAAGTDDGLSITKGKSAGPAFAGGFAVVSTVAGANDAHPSVECSGKGVCDRKTGECACFGNYEGIACERTVCPNNCNDAGVCFTEKQLAAEASLTYSTPWDAEMHVGCICDIGRRGPDCSLIECPSGSDPLKGYGNAAGRDCSGRGICDYSSGSCNCFHGYYGTKCEYQTVLG